MRVILFFACLLILGSAQLNCPQLPPHTPTSIHDLAPNDIQVVMALGDSVTAAFGLQGLSGGINEYRGQSWSIGGDSGAITVANFLRYFNPALIGASVGHHIVEVCYGPICPPYQYHPTEDVFNAAQSGAMISDVVGHELDYLIAQLQANPLVNLTEDWKLLTLFIGANDLCIACTFANQWLTPDEFYQHTFAVLERIRQNIPRVFVNLVPIFNLSGVYELSLKSSYCSTIHRVLFLECDCIFSPGANKTRQLIDEYGQAYGQKLFDLAAYYAAQNYSDFAAVVQPGFMDQDVSELPIDFLSTLDCFHPSLLAHQNMAINLWNNMLLPASQKVRKMALGTQPTCPTPETRIWTT